jgi:lipopolysaccharide/colanic/teichoic acid biosynthesis glycosyltransferase
MTPPSPMLSAASCPGGIEIEVSGWNQSKGKRLFDLFFAAVLLILVSPAMLIVALLVKTSSRGPALYRQWRVGKDGRQFQLIKFRTMGHASQQAGPSVTRAGDPRITAAGRVLRKWKLDELPQLLNVIRGEMSFVGPRPDVAEYITSLNREQQKILQLRPGLTGAATLHYRNEERLLSSVPVAELKRFYCSNVLPEKVRLDLEYARSAGFLSDLGILLRTAGAILP